MRIDVKENETGYLLPLSLKELPFVPKRFFVVKNKIKNAARGNHAHVNEEHMLICLNGLIYIKHEDSNGVGEVILKTGEFFHQRELQWLNLNFLEENTMLLVYANTEYDEKNYIRDYDHFKKMINKDKDA